MNEMNNGDNGFNNQNFEQNFNGNQNNINYGAQQSYNQNNMIQPEQPVNNQVEPPKGKNYCGLLVVFMVVSLLLAGFIVYDKAIKKEEPKPDILAPVVQNELVKFAENQLSEKDESGNKYFKNLVYENSKLKLEFKFFLESLSDKKAINYDLFINGVLKKSSINVDNYYIEADADETSFANGGLSLEEKEEAAIETIKNAIGTIKGDKYYIFIDFKMDDSSITFINENGLIIDSNVKAFYDYYEELSLTSECKSYSYATKTDDGDYIGNHFILNDAIYYLDLHGKNSCSWSDGEMADEYKITISKDKVNSEKINSCHLNGFINGKC